MGCGTIYNTPNSTINISQNLIYVTNTAQNAKNRKRQIQEVSHKSIEKKKFQGKQQAKILKTQNTSKKINCKLISLNDLKLKGNQKKVRFRGSLQVQNLDSFQNKQNQLANNIFQNQRLISQQRKLKKISFKFNKSNQKLVFSQETSVTLNKTPLQSLYKSRAIKTQIANIKDQKAKNPNFKTFIEQQKLLPKINKQLIPLEPKYISSKEEIKKIINERVNFLRVPSIENQPRNINQLHNFQLYYDKQNSLQRNTYNQRTVKKELNSFNSSQNNNYRSFQSSVYFPDIESIPNQRLFQKNIKKFIKQDRNRN